MVNKLNDCFKKYFVSGIEVLLPIMLALSVLTPVASIVGA